MSKVIHVDSDEEFDKILNANASKLVVIDFFATWCGPCKKIAPEFEKISMKYDAVFLKVDVDILSKAAEKHSVKAMPTFICIKDGKKVGEVVGASIDKVEEMIKANQ
ncbi:unnamed protein product [Schistosoma turkestanicum]|nr:unnamed protein product [Schistosoma turkestanicum]